jgi:putative Ca2+/H+ antiporter (TMEM165/GDT1 family)
VLIEPEALVKTNGLIGEPPIEAAIAHSADSTSASEQASAMAQESNSHFWKLFGSTFITIFLAELGDKTQVATLLMTAESHAPWVVFAGAAIALVSTSLIGVLIGHWLSSRISPKMLDRAAGILLAFISLCLFLDVVRM